STKMLVSSVYFTLFAEAQGHRRRRRFGERLQTLSRAHHRTQPNRAPDLWPRSRCRRPTRVERRPAFTGPWRRFFEPSPFAGPEPTAAVRWSRCALSHLTRSLPPYSPSV